MSAISAEENPVRILVIDDNTNNRKAAIKQLAGHDVTTVEHYVTAESYIMGRATGEKVTEEMVKRGLQPYPPSITGEYLKWIRAKEEVKAQLKPEPFDLVLVDLLMPPQSMPNWSSMEPMPVGIFLGLLAAKRGARYVAVFTDSSHHDHPASACFDSFNDNEHAPTSFAVAGASMILTNNRDWVQVFDPSDLTKPLEYEYEDYKGRVDTVRAKRWDLLLKCLLGEKAEGA